MIFFIERDVICGSEPTKTFEAVIVCLSSHNFPREAFNLSTFTFFPKGVNIFYQQTFQASLRALDELLTFLHRFSGEQRELEVIIHLHYSELIHCQAARHAKPEEEISRSSPRTHPPSPASTAQRHLTTRCHCAILYAALI